MRALEASYGRGVCCGASQGAVCVNAKRGEKAKKAIELLKQDKTLAQVAEATGIAKSHVSELKQTIEPLRFRDGKALCTGHLVDGSPCPMLPQRGRKTCWRHGNDRSGRPVKNASYSKIFKDLGLVKRIAAHENDPNLIQHRTEVAQLRALYELEVQDLSDNRPPLELWAEASQLFKEAQTAGEVGEETPTLRELGELLDSAFDAERTARKARAAMERLTDKIGWHKEREWRRLEVMQNNVNAKAVDAIQKKIVSAVTKWITDENIGRYSAFELLGFIAEEFRGHFS